jgi:Fe-S-cluster-containing hydrogenase component 2
MDNILFAIPDLCTGCNRCAYVCSAVKEGMFIPSKSRIHINNFNLKGYAVPSICFQCPKPECLEACPEEAIYKDETDVVLVDLNKCNGCGDCVTACPYGMIEQDAEGLAYKCDYCNGDPACIKECEPGSIVYHAEDKEQRKLRGLQMKQRIESGNPEEKRHQLGLNILDKARSGN